MSAKNVMSAKPRAPRQLSLLGKGDPFYGGSLRTTRRSRETPRPLAVKKSMHVVMRSSLAKGSRSFQSGRNAKKIAELIRIHAARNHVRVFSFANVGNHIHLHIQLSYRKGYARFIRALTSAIAMHVMGWNRWTGGKARVRAQTQQGNTLAQDSADSASAASPQRFWDFRPYTNVVTSWTGFLRLKDYVQINQFEAGGLPRSMACLIVKGSDVFRKAAHAARASPPPR